MPDALDLAGDKMTIAAWVQPQSAQAGPLVRKMNNDHGYRVNLTGTRAIRFVFRRYGRTKIVTSTTTLPLHQWTHVAARYDGAEMRIFINGTLDTAVTAATRANTPRATTAPVLIGAHTNNYHFHGHLDDISIYDRALSDSEITDLVNDVDKRYEYHHLNALGSNIVLTDDNQTVLARYEYDVFGAIRNETGTSDNTRKFTGKEFDADSNLYYYRARYYDPYIGRFTQRDPVGQGVNWYAYTANNPLKYTDPTGMWFETGVDIIGLGLSIYDFIKNPTLGNAGWVVLDLGALVLPVVPSTKVGRLGISIISKSDPAELFKKGRNFNRKNYRDGLFDISGVSKATAKAEKLDAHHIIPKQFEDLVMDRFGINVHEPWLLTWWKRGPEGSHYREATEYGIIWEKWFADNPNATVEDLMQFTGHMAHKYRKEYYNEKYYFKMHERVPVSASDDYMKHN